MKELDSVSPAGTADGKWASRAEIEHLVQRFSGLETEIRSTHALLRTVGTPDSSRVFLEKLERLVETPGAFRFTPRAVATYADESHAAVRRVSGGHDAVVASLRTEITDVFRDWADDPNDFEPFDPTWRSSHLVDLETQLEPNLGGAQMRKFPQETVHEEYRRATAAGGNPTIEDVLDEGFLGKVAHVGLQDIGAEVIGREALVLTPEGSNESFVIFFEYIDG